MARTLKPLSFSFSEKMVKQIEARAMSLGLSRSAYLRQLVSSDLNDAGNDHGKGKQSFPERFRELENTVKSLQEKIAMFSEIENHLSRSVTETKKRGTAGGVFWEDSGPRQLAPITKEERKSKSGGSG